MNLELDAKRTRVRLQEDAQPTRTRVKLAEEQEEAGPFSPWKDLCRDKPPCSGMWDVRPYQNDRKVFRALYNIELNSWTVPGWPFPTVSLAECEWRGLAYDPSKA